ncbi:hypothetical protein BV22DRAFT_1039366 [Leucogyrophana mollusca]|uniref:Uncharacterized protein n=1 Tax=Leucogyrophana mollusca TaxID=85980 RepID=A0ACB8B602_9AGAM|nr:hypothetical protein BV22DRAFT_1039366 [Leucogyrophana mollusca]
MQLAFNSIVALAVAVACVQALSVQEKRESVDLVDSTPEKRAPFRVSYEPSKEETENTEGTTVEKRYNLAEDQSENAEGTPEI